MGEFSELCERMYQRPAALPSSCMELMTAKGMREMSIHVGESARKGETRSDIWVEEAAAGSGDTSTTTR